MVKRAPMPKSMDVRRCKWDLDPFSICTGDRWVVGIHFMSFLNLFFFEEETIWWSCLDNQFYKIKILEFLKILDINYKKYMSFKRPQRTAKTTRRWLEKERRSSRWSQPYLLIYDGHAFLWPTKYIESKRSIGGVGIRFFF